VKTLRKLRAKVGGESRGKWFEGTIREKKVPHEREPLQRDDGRTHPVTSSIELQGNKATTEQDLKESKASHQNPSSTRREKNGIGGERRSGTRLRGH